MQPLNKKPSVLVGGAVRATIDQASKAALVDLVSDFLRLRIGREDASDDEMIAAFLEAMEPVAIARDDKKPEAWRPPARRQSRPAVEFCQEHRRLKSLCPCAVQP